jgi:hypothetical protein
MLPRYICLNASEVASLAGRHRYQPRKECILKMFKSIEPEAFARQSHVLQEDRTNGIWESVLKSCQAIDSQVTLARDVGRNSGSTSSEVLVATESAIREIDLHFEAAGKEGSESSLMLSPGEIKLVKEKCRSMLYTHFGTHKEDSVAQEVRNATSRDIVKDDVYRKRLWFEITADRHDPESSSTRVFIGGKCDGVMQCATGAKIVEIKNRMKRLFRSVPEYEKIQLMSYLFIHGVRDGILIEKHNDSSMEHNVPFDPEYWQDIAADIREALEELRSMKAVGKETSTDY